MNNTTKRKVLIGVWVDPIIKEELDRRANRNGLSISATTNALVTRALQQTIDMEYGALLEPIIRQEIRRQIHSYSSRIALLLVRVSFACEQTKNLVTNILSRQPNQHLMTPDILDHILDASAKGARQKITLKSPQLEQTLKDVETWLTEEPNKER